MMEQEGTVVLSQVTGQETKLKKRKKKSQKKDDYKLNTSFVA